VATRERRLLEQLIKSWAQDHDSGHVIADYATTEEALKSTQGYFTWVIREGLANIDLQTLADRIEIFLENRRKRKHPDGMFCKNCNNFYQFAESNQSDGTLICYSCTNSP
jgi:hypothetical protein